MKTKTYRKALKSAHSNRRIKSLRIKLLKSKRIAKENLWKSLIRGAEKIRALELENQKKVNEFQPHDSNRNDAQSLDNVKPAKNKKITTASKQKS